MLQAHSRGPVDRALIVAQYFWPEQLGSAPYLTDIADFLSAQGVRVDVVTSRPHYPTSEVFDGYRRGERDRQLRGSVRIFRTYTRAPRGGRAFGRVAADALALLGTVSLIARRRVSRSDLTLSLSPSILTVVGGRLATRRGGRHVTLVHDIQSGLASGLGLVGNGWLLRLMRMLERWAMNRVDHVVVLSERMRQVLLEQGVRTDLTVLPIWVDEQRIRPMSRPVGAQPTVLYSGNFGRKQGLGQILDMAELLGASAPHVRVVLRGDGSLREDLVREIARRRLDQVELRAPAPPCDLNEALAEGDVHLVPQDPNASDFAVPSKLIAILAAGRPVVCTAAPSSPLDRFGRETGALVCVPPARPELLAGAVIELLEEPERRAAMGTRGREWVERYASRGIVLERLGTLLGIPTGTVGNAVPRQGAIA